MTTDARTGDALDVLLRGGAIAQVRPLVAADEPALRRLNARVSLRTRVRRWFTASEAPGDWYVDRLVASVASDGALVALVDGEVVALAAFARLERDPAVADLSLLVDDEHQTSGLGALLLEHLAQLAADRGVTGFVADVLVDNRPMLRLLAASGLATTAVTSHGVVTLAVDLDDRPQLWQALHDREARAERESLLRVLAPRSVAVVGSRRPGSVASEVHRYLLAGGFTGAVHTVDRDGSLVGLGAPLDLVVVAVPAASVLDVARDAGAAGAKGLLVMTAGFAEQGADGALSQAALLRLCRDRGMRLVGPNCLGLVNTDPAVRLNATFCDAAPAAGGVALVSQSGAVGIAALRHAERRGARLSVFVSTGNKADVSGNDLLLHLEADPRTTVIALYLESFGNARKFGRVAAAVGRHKPVVVVKAGRSEAGARAGRSHTAAAATPDVAVTALLREAGVLRVDDLPAMFDVLAVLSPGLLPTGRRLAVIGNSGGPGVLAADACAVAGLELADLSADTTAGLAALLPGGASVSNPVDMLATVGVDAFEAAVALVLRDPSVDAVLTIYTPLVAGAEEPVAAALARAAAGAPDRLLVATFPGLAGAPSALGQLPFFELPEPAVRALGTVAAHVAWRDALPQDRDRRADHDVAVAARALLGEVAEARWLTPQAATDLLDLYGVTTSRVVDVSTAAEARAAGDELGYPVALKASGPTVVHKSDSGGVRLDLRDGDAVVAAMARAQESVGPAMTSAVVQRMHVAAGLELIAGIVVDPSVGPLVLVGAGGTMTDLLDDRVLRLPPTTRAAALDQLRALRCAPLLDGYRGSPALDVDAVVDVLLRLSDLAHDLPEVLELDLNPLVVGPSGATALDVRVRVGTATWLPDTPTRALARART